MNTKLTESDCTYLLFLLDAERESYETAIKKEDDYEVAEDLQEKIEEIDSISEKINRMIDEIQGV